MYNPDRWIIIKLKQNDETFYKVLGGWSGGYLDGDSWRMNSGIERVETTDTHYLFHGFSGSVYKCHKSGYGANMIMSSVLSHFDGTQAEILPEQDFSSLFD